MYDFDSFDWAVIALCYVAAAGIGAMLSLFLAVLMGASLWLWAFPVVGVAIAGLIHWRTVT